MLLKDDPYADIKLLEVKLKQLGYTSQVQDAIGTTYYQFTAPNRKSWLTQGVPVNYPSTHSGITRLSVRKDLAYHFLEQNNVRVPETYIVQDGQIDESDLRTMLDNYPTLITKPVNASLSRGLTINIDSYDKLIDGIRHALNFNITTNSVVVQEQVRGEEIRFVILDGKVESAMLRQTPQVMGNGSSTIQELIQAENASRRQINVPYLVYPQLDSSLVDPLLLQSACVPREGEVVKLSSATMIKDGASIYDILEDLDQSYKDKVESIVQMLGADFIVVDLFIIDHTMPLADDNYAFIEFNTSPSLKLFYSCRDGLHFDAVNQLAQLIDRSLIK